MVHSQRARASAARLARPAHRHVVADGVHRTDPALIPPQVKQDLAPIIGKYIK